MSLAGQCSSGMSVVAMHDALQQDVESLDPGEAQLLRRLWLGLWRSLALYAVFLLPTVLWVVWVTPQASQPAHDSRWLWDSLVQGWRCTACHVSVLTAKTSNVVLDVLRAILVFGLGWEFVQCYRQLSSQETLSTRAQQTVHKISLLWVVLGIGILIPVIPFHSSDLYGYLNRGFQQSILHTNPYLTPIAEIPNWKRYAFLQPHWIYNPCPYGFAFAQLVNLLTRKAEGSFIQSVVYLKLLNG